MPDWICSICGKTFRGRLQVPLFCPRCGLGLFDPLEEETPPRSESNVAPPAEPPAPPSAPVSESASALQAASTPVVPIHGPGPRPAKRIRPKEPLEVRFPRTIPLEALDISASGLLVEHAKPFPPGSICDLELWRAGLGVRVRAEVVRSVVSGGGKGSRSGVLYRTAVHFLETPQSIYMLLPELSD